MPDFWPFCQGGGQRSIQASHAAGRRSDHGWPRLRLPSRCPASPAPVARCSTWHNGTMAQWSQIPPPSHKIHKDSRPPRLCATRVRMPPTLGIQYDTMDVHDSKELWSIMINYAVSVLAKIVAFIYPYVGQRHILWAVPVSLSEYLWRGPSGPINHDQPIFVLGQKCALAQTDEIWSNKWICLRNFSWKLRLEMSELSLHISYRKHEDTPQRELLHSCTNPRWACSLASERSSAYKAPCFLS